MPRCTTTTTTKQQQLAIPKMLRCAALECGLGRRQTDVGPNWRRRAIDRSESIKLYYDSDGKTGKATSEPIEFPRSWN
jgi:hypothetical protein